jgi:hypothetical protein
MEDALLEFLQDEIMSGKRADSSFKSKTWQDAVAVVNENLTIGRAVQRVVTAWIWR